MAGILYGVGVGPGDPELMTVKAVKVIKESDVIGIPAKDIGSCTAYQIAKKAVPQITGKPLLAVPVPMTTDRKKLSDIYEQGCQRIIEELKKERKVAFLNLGDPMVYGSYMELHQRVRSRGYDAKVISGVPSFCAVAATMEIPLGTRREEIHILPGCYYAQEVGQYDGTKVLMKSGGKFEEVKERLMQLEAQGRGKVFAVTNCGMENQMVCRDIRELEEKPGYFTTIIVKEENNR